MTPRRCREVPSRKPLRLELGALGEPTSRPLAGARTSPRNQLRDGGENHSSRRTLAAGELRRRDARRRERRQATSSGCGVAIAPWTRGAPTSGPAARPGSRRPVRPGVGGQPTLLACPLPGGKPRPFAGQRPDRRPRARAEPTPGLPGRHGQLAGDERGWCTATSLLRPRHRLHRPLLRGDLRPDDYRLNGPRRAGRQVAWQPAAAFDPPNGSAASTSS